jgi:hypothetical protein
MSSRRNLWTILALGALPLFLEATTGCDVLFGLQRIEVPNSLYCACSCDAGGGGPRNVLVAMGSDDAEESAGSVDLTNGDLDLGSNIVGIRFENLVIPQGATILAAYVQFVGDVDGETDTTNLVVRAEASTTAATFSSADNDISGRTPGMFQVAWAPGPWNNGEAGLAQRTEDIKSLLQELVSDPAWNDGSSIVLRFEGSGQRSAESFEGSDQAPLLIVEMGAAVAATLPICASEAAMEGGLSAADLVAECERVEATLTGIAGACSYPQPCSCELVDQKDPSGGDRPDSVEAATCSDGCTEMEVDAPACDTFDPNAFTQCVADGGTLADCKPHVSATHAGADSPVCVSSGSALAFHAFGERSRCELEGTADIHVGDRQPTSDPKTAGAVEVVGGPCPGGTCKIHPSFGLRMNDIEFEVRWASNPTFHDLGAEGRGLDSADVPSSGDAVFGSDAILGTGVGRRGFKALAIDATNPDPLGLGVNWADKTCYMDGALAVGVGDDGTCEMDPMVPCASDDDCVGVGGVCLLPPPSDEMTIDVLLDGDLVNQPPRAAAGADQSVECTSSAGASFVLDGRGSSDPDRNLALVSWHQGTRTGPLLSNDLLLPLSLGLGASESYVLRAVDGYAQTDESETTVEVVDTTPPEIACNAPATIVPPDGENLPSFGATATDVCDTDVAAEVTSYDCFTTTKKGRRVSKLESCIVSFQGDTLTISDVGGYGDHISWTVRATDDSGNVGQATCEVVVQK